MRSTKSVNSDQRILSALPTVKRLAAQYQRRSRLPVELDDLEQAGTLGALKASRAPGYRLERGTFGAYSYRWIKAEIQACILRQLTIHRPRGSGMPFKIYQAAETIRSRGREPDPAELGISQEQWDLWQRPPGRSVSNAQPETVPSADRNPEEAYQDAQDQRAASTRMAALPVRSRRILEGMSAGVSRKAMAAREGLSEERVRQIRRDALAAIVA
jgi:RNA polymerase sigma factor (sigma-70 family)